MKKTNMLNIPQIIPVDKNGQSVIPAWFLVPVLLVGLWAMGTVAGGSDAKAAAERIHRDGYTDIEIAPGRAHLCPSSMEYGRDFKAINAKGIAVSGSICGTVMNPNVLITVR